VLPIQYRDMGGPSLLYVRETLSDYLKANPALKLHRVDLNLRAIGIYDSTTHDISLLLDLSARKNCAPYKLSNHGIVVSSNHTHEGVWHRSRTFQNMEQGLTELWQATEDYKRW